MINIILYFMISFKISSQLLNIFNQLLKGLGFAIREGLKQNNKQSIQNQNIINSSKRCLPQYKLKILKIAIIIFMNPRTEMKEEVNSKLDEFLFSMEKLYSNFNCQVPWQRSNIHHNLLSFLLPKLNSSSSNEFLESFLEASLNNEGEKKIRQNFLRKDPSYSKDTFVFFENNDSHNDDENLDEKQRSDDRIQILGKYKEILESQNEESMKNQKYKEDDSGILYETDKKEYKIYSNKMKTDILDYAEKYGIKIAAAHYNLSCSRIKLWKKKGERAINRGRKPIDPEMQMNLVNWLQREIWDQKYITQKLIRKKAKQLSISKVFKASKGWLEKFFKRNSELFSKYLKSKDRFLKSLMKKNVGIQEPSLKCRSIIEMQYEEMKFENVNIFDSML